MLFFKNIFSKCLDSNLEFTADELDIKLRHNIINLTLFLAILGLIYGLVNNILKGDITGAFVNIAAIVMILISGIFLRYFKKSFELITTIMAAEFLILFDILITISQPASLKHVWLITFPSLIFFYKGTKNWLIWVFIFIASLYLTKAQTFHPIAYSYGEITYLSVVILTMTAIVYFYKNRIDIGNETIKAQKEQLKRQAQELEKMVVEKTKELQELNQNLEVKVAQKAQELVQKDELILAQSRQAAMGEMISMIAHQWRQPLSTITLQISNLKINSLLGKQSIEATNDALEHISSTIIYLSETIDDFQSFFKPNKKQEYKNICELVERGTNFAKPRLIVANIELIYSCDKEITILTYPNEFAQVIINLINNAIDVLLERKVLTPKIEVAIRQYQQSVDIIICDNAGGIEMKNSTKIFEPYFSTKGKNGTGLGLYMSKRIIESELGGILKVHNNTKGAEFTITLPLSEESLT